MKLLDKLIIALLIILLLIVIISQERRIERLEKRMTSIEQLTNASFARIDHNSKLDSQRITNIENPQFIQKSYKQNKGK